MSPNFIFRSSSGGALARIFYALASSMALYISVWNNVDVVRDRLSSLGTGVLNRNGDNTFDFIIVGAGSSGSVVAHRLSEKYNVLLLEAGGEPFAPLMNVPGFSILSLQNYKEIDHMYKTVPQKRACGALNGKVSSWPSGRGLGGSSNIDFMIHSRGHPNDFDSWANLTSDSQWCYNSVLPFFKKMEDYSGDWEYSGYHGRGGPVRIAISPEKLTGDLFIEAAQEYGYSKMDINGRFTEGFDNIYMPISQSGRRQSAYNAYIKPIRKRQSLTIQKFSNVNKVLIRDDSKEAYGVEYTRHGQNRQAYATREVVLSAGAIQTPKILQLSGIGKRDHLESLGIPVKYDSPSVGSNLQDHVAIILGPFFVNEGKSMSIDRDVKMRDLLHWFRHGTGVFSTSPINSIGYVTSKYAKEEGQDDWPDIQYLYSGVSYFRQYPKLFSKAFNLRQDILSEYTANALDKDSFSIITVLSRPVQRGEILIKSKNPTVHPSIDPHYLESERDVKILIEGVKKAIDIVEKSKSFQAIGASFTTKPFPGCEKVEFRSDEYFECWIRQATLTMHDVVGTASMGPKGSKAAVVDPNLRLIGIKNLRVIDCSVIPIVGIGHTNAMALMLGEKGADLILKQWNSNISNKEQLNDKAAKVLNENTISSILMGNFNGKPALNIQIKDFEGTSKNSDLSTSTSKSTTTPSTTSTTLTTTTTTTTPTTTTTTTTPTTTTTTTTPTTTTATTTTTTTSTTETTTSKVPSTTPVSELSISSTITVSTNETDQGVEKRGRSHDSPNIKGTNEDSKDNEEESSTMNNMYITNQDVQNLLENLKAIIGSPQRTSTSKTPSDNETVDSNEFVVSNSDDPDKSEEVNVSTSEQNGVKDDSDISKSVIEEDTEDPLGLNDISNVEGSVSSNSFGGTSFDDIEWEFPPDDDSALSPPGQLESSTGSSLVKSLETSTEKDNWQESHKEAPVGRKVPESPTRINSIDNISILSSTTTASATERNLDDMELSTLSEQENLTSEENTLRNNKHKATGDNNVQNNKESNTVPSLKTQLDKENSNSVSTTELTFPVEDEINVNASNTKASLEIEDVEQNSETNTVKPESSVYNETEKSSSPTSSVKFQLDEDYKKSGASDSTVNIGSDDIEENSTINSFINESSFPVPDVTENKEMEEIDEPNSTLPSEIDEPNSTVPSDDELTSDRNMTNTTVLDHSLNKQLHSVSPMKNQSDKPVLKISLDDTEIIINVTDSESTVVFEVTNTTEYKDNDEESSTLQSEIDDNQHDSNKNTVSPIHNPTEKSSSSTSSVKLQLDEDYKKSGASDSIVKINSDSDDTEENVTKSLGNESSLVGEDVTENKENDEQTSTLPADIDAVEDVVDKKSIKSTLSVHEMTQNENFNVTAVSLVKDSDKVKDLTTSTSASKESVFVVDQLIKNKEINESKPLLKINSDVEENFTTSTSKESTEDIKNETISPPTSSTSSKIPDDNIVINEEQSSSESTTETEDDVEQTTISVEDDDIKVISVMGDIPIKSTNILYSSSSQSVSRTAVKNSQNFTVKQVNNFTDVSVAQDKRKGRNQSPIVIVSKSTPSSKPKETTLEETQTESIIIMTETINNSSNFDGSLEATNVNTATSTVVSGQNSSSNNSTSASSSTSTNNFNETVSQSSDTSKETVSIQSMIEASGSNSSYVNNSSSASVNINGVASTTSPSTILLNEHGISSTLSNNVSGTVSTMEPSSTSVLDKINKVLSTTGRSTKETSESTKNDDSLNVVSNSTSSSSSEDGTSFDDINWNDDFPGGNLTSEKSPVLNLPSTSTETTVDKTVTSKKDNEMVTQGSQASAPISVPLILSITLGNIALLYKFLDTY